MISAVVHTYNEEKHIQRCLSSLFFVEEIILVDMNSTDKTVEKAKEFNAKIFTHPFTGFVEPARNFGIKQARGEWIVILDADEEIPRSLSTHLKKINKDGYDFFRIPRKNIIFDKWIKYGGWWPDYQVRFFRNGKVTWVDKIHGIPITRGVGRDLNPVEELSIIHHNYQTINQFLERLNRYSSISSKELYLQNEKFHIGKLFEKPVDEFVKRLFLLRGYKDGVHGLALSMLQSASELATYLKLWELEKFKESKLELSKMERLLSEETKQKRYWLINEAVKQERSGFKKILLKLRMKLYNR